jgi:hypothetical protein
MIDLRARDIVCRCNGGKKPLKALLAEAATVNVPAVSGEPRAPSMLHIGVAYSEFFRNLDILIHVALVDGVLQVERTNVVFRPFAVQI